MIIDIPVFVVRINNQVVQADPIQNIHSTAQVVFLSQYVTFEEIKIELEKHFIKTISDKKLELFQKNGTALIYSEAKDMSSIGKIKCGIEYFKTVIE